MGEVTPVAAAWAALTLSPAAPHVLPVAADWIEDHDADAATCHAVRSNTYSPSPVNPRGFGEPAGYGNGDGNGNGNGDGYGDGYGDGNGYGNGDGYGGGNGYGYGDGNGYGNGDGYGGGYGGGYGDGYGNGNGAQNPVARPAGDE